MYNRLFTKILDSSIWLEPDSTRIVWITLLAAMNEEGYAHFSAIENLASRAHVSIAKAKKAIECFESPDPNSENLANEGRRIERVPGGYMVLNAPYYRERFTREIEREQTRLRVAKHRAKKGQGNKTSVTETLHTVSPASASKSVSVSKLKEGVRGRFEKWMQVRRDMGKAPKDWSGMFNEQIEWLLQFSSTIQTEILSASIRNNWQGLFEPKQSKNGARPDEHNKLDQSKIDVPERFRAWVSEHYPDRREAAMKWRTWGDVPACGLREEWWRGEKKKLPVGHLL